MLCGGTHTTSYRLCRFRHAGHVTTGPEAAASGGAPSSDSEAEEVRGVEGSPACTPLTTLLPFHARAQEQAVRPSQQLPWQQLGQAPWPASHEPTMPQVGLRCCDGRCCWAVQ